MKSIIKGKKFLLVAFFLILSIFFLTNYYLKKTQKKTKAAGEGVMLTLAYLRWIANQEIIVAVRVKPSVPMSIRGYRFSVGFDVGSVSVKNIEYKLGRVSIGLGDDNNNLTEVNKRGKIIFQGEIQEPQGYVLSPNNETEVGVITFSAPATATKGIAFIDRESVKFYKIEADSRITEVGSLEPTPTPTFYCVPDGQCRKINTKCCSGTEFYSPDCPETKSACGILKGETRLYIDPNPVNSGQKLTVVATATKSCSTDPYNPPKSGGGFIKCGLINSSCDGKNPKDELPCWWQWECEAYVPGTYLAQFSAAFNGNPKDYSTCLSTKNYTVAVPTPIFTPTITPPLTSSPNCFCINNQCSTTCPFSKYNDSSYSTPIKCTLSSSLFSSPPQSQHQDSWCQRPMRTQGDANGDNKVDKEDYFYYVQAVNGGKIPPSINPDANGDGEVGVADREIIVKKIISVTPPPLTPTPTTCVPATLPFPEPELISPPNNSQIFNNDMVVLKVAPVDNYLALICDKTSHIEYRISYKIIGEEQVNYGSWVTSPQRKIDRLNLGVVEWWAQQRIVDQFGNIKTTSKESEHWRFYVAAIVKPPISHFPITATPLPSLLPSPTSIIPSCPKRCDYIETDINKVKAYCQALGFNCTYYNYISCAVACGPDGKPQWANFWDSNLNKCVPPYCEGCKCLNSPPPTLAPP